MYKVLDAKSGSESVGFSLTHERLHKSLMNGLDVRTCYMCAYLKGEAKKRRLERLWISVDKNPYNPCNVGTEKNSP